MRDKLNLKPMIALNNERSLLKSRTSDQLTLLMVFRSRYKIIELGVYSHNVKYTQKRNNIQYQILDGYVVKTEVANQVLRCETKYTIANKVLYTITWKEVHAEWIVSSERSASGAVNAFLKKINREKSQLSGTHVFGFNIEILHRIRIGQSNESTKARTISKIIDKRKRPLNEIQSLSQQTNDMLYLEEKLAKNMELENGTNIINIKYNSILDPIRLDAYVCACDEALLGRDGYRRLAAVEARLIREYQVAQKWVEITKLINYQVHIGTFNLDKEFDQQPILDDDEYQENPDGTVVEEQEIGNGDTINLKLSGDDKNVGRKQNHVMLTFCLLNEKDEVLKPDHQHCAHWDINLKWKINKNTQSKKKPELFPAIKQENYIPDELHLLLRISDMLMECLFNDLFKKKDFERLIKCQIEQVMKSINVHFEFFKSKFHSGKWNWTSLMGPDKKKVLQHFPVTTFISGKRDSEIDDLEVKVQLFFGGTTMDGGIRGKSVVQDIMEFENRQLYYLLNNTP
ncbi:hypothetical protein C1646_755055 [Rhizophagus diaphanus]|nr:hypothetical protein C1646_755055 [Rhizophagus diaphanus] [Rhizophagus sp. MUCL 43196]